MRREGTVLMEATFCLPLLVALFVGIIEIVRLWQSRHLVDLAAYHAARAALVYHPREYQDGAGEFLERSGVAWAAAVETLVPVAQPNGFRAGLARHAGDRGVLRPGTSAAALRTRIVPERSREDAGAVTVTVEYSHPHLLAPVIPFAEGDTAPWTLFSPALVTETCVLPKPWSTATYPRLSDAERDFLLTKGKNP